MSGRPDSAEISALLEQCRPGLKAVIRRWHLPPADAEDVVQQALLVALGQWTQIRNPAAWLPGVVERICRNRTRTALYAEVVGFEANRWDDRLSVAPAQHHWELLADLERLSDQLPAHYRRVLALRYFWGMTNDEVAPLVGVSPASVRKVVGRSLAVISARLRGGDPVWKRRMRGLSWSVAVAEYLGQRLLAARTTKVYRRYLLRAGEILECRIVREVSLPSLTGYRVRIAREIGAAASLAAAVGALRSFLRWSGALGMHQLSRAEVRDALAEERVGVRDEVA